MTKVLIANRGAIACRILRTVRKMGLSSVAVSSDADADSMHVRQADQSVALGTSAPATSYLDAAKILNAAKHSEAAVIHPGYGFLSENAGFAEACEREGMAFAGPTPDQIRKFGLKNTARDLAKACGLPLLPGTDLLESVEEAMKFAAETVVHQIAPRAILFIHTERDTMVPVEESKIMHERAGAPKKLFLIPGADHKEVYEEINA